MNAPLKALLKAQEMGTPSPGEFREFNGEFTNLLAALDAHIDTATRASNATYWDADGVLQTAGTDVMRSNAYCDHDPVTGDALGWLIEEQQINQVRNPRCEGAVVGGAKPSNWTLSNSAGLTVDVAGLPVIKGMQCVKLRYYGTASSTNILLITETTTQIVAATGQVWSNSMEIAYENNGGAAEPTGFNLSIAERTSAGAQVTNHSGPTIAPSSTIKRFNYSVTFSGGATVARTTPQLFASVVSGSNYDFYLTIAIPNMVNAAFATSPILPPVGTPAASTRARDIPAITDLDSINFNASEGTLLFEFSLRGLGSSNNPVVAGITDGTAANRLLLRVNDATSDNISFVVVAAGVTSAVVVGPTAVAGVKYKAAISWANNSFRLAVNGIGYTEVTSGAVPVVDRLSFGLEISTQYLNGWLKQAGYMPVQMPQSFLNSWSAP